MISGCRWVWFHTVKISTKWVKLAICRLFYVVADSLHVCRHVTHVMQKSFLQTLVLIWIHRLGTRIIRLVSSSDNNPNPYPFIIVVQKWSYWALLYNTGSLLYNNTILLITVYYNYFSDVIYVYQKIKFLVNSWLYSLIFKTIFSRRKLLWLLWWQPDILMTNHYSLTTKITLIPSLYKHFKIVI